MKAQTIKQMTLEEYLDFKRIPIGDASIKILTAYADCLPEIVNTSSLERNLDFYCTDALTLEQAYLISDAANPYGYNGFDTAKAFTMIAKYFGNDCTIYFARESSVCLYIKPKSRVWISRLMDEKRSIADEISYEPETNTFRLWWD